MRTQTHRDIVMKSGYGYGYNMTKDFFKTILSSEVVETIIYTIVIVTVTVTDIVTVTVTDIVTARQQKA